MLRGGRLAKPPHPYKPLGLLAGPLLHRQETFCLSTKSWGQLDIFPLAAAARSPPAASNLHNFHAWLLNLIINHFIVIYVSRRYQCTPHLFHLGKYWGSYTCINLCRATPRPLLSRALSRDNIPLKVPYLLAHTFDWGVLEHSRIATP